MSDAIDAVIRESRLAEIREWASAQWTTHRRGRDFAQYLLASLDETESALRGMLEMHDDGCTFCEDARASLAAASRTATG